MPLCAGVNQMRGPAVQLLVQPLGREIPLKIFTDMLSYLPDVCINVSASTCRRQFFTCPHVTCYFWFYFHMRFFLRVTWKDDF